MNEQPVLNEERMLAVADAIEQDALRDRNVGFDMGTFMMDLANHIDWDLMMNLPLQVKPEYRCGMVACIGGHACLMYGRVGTNIDDEQAAMILGLTEDQAERLFFNEGSYVADANLDDITREQAVAAIRRMVREEGRPAQAEPAKVEEPELVCA